MTKDKYVVIRIWEDIEAESHDEAIKISSKIPHDEVGTKRVTEDGIQTRRQGKVHG